MSVPSIGAFSGYPDPTGTSAPTPPASPVNAIPSAQQQQQQAQPQADSKSAAVPFSPAIADAPSPTPQSIVTDTKSLPLSVQFAPSSVPHIEIVNSKFDRRA
jgi:hypothetical protein